MARISDVMQLTDGGSNYAKAAAAQEVIPKPKAASTTNTAASNAKANNSAVSSALNKSAAGVSPNASAPTASAAQISNNTASIQQPVQQQYAPQYYTPSAMPDYTELLRQAQEAAALARAQAIEASVRGYETYRPEIAQQGDAARAQAYANSRLSAIGNNELLAAQGLAGGMYDSPYSGTSETSRVAQDNTMRTNLQSATEAEQKAYAELDRAIAQLRANGQMAEADALAANAQAIVQLQIQQEQANYERQMQANQYNFQQQQYADQLNYQAQQDALNKAQTLSQYGDFSGYNDLGWDTAAMQTAYTQAQQQAAAKASSGGSSGSATASKPSLSRTDVDSAIKQGFLTPEVIAAANSYYGDGWYDYYTGSQQKQTQPTSTEISALVYMAPTQQEALNTLYANASYLTQAEFNAIYNNILKNIQAAPKNYGNGVH